MTPRECLQYELKAPDLTEDFCDERKSSEITPSFTDWIILDTDWSDDFAGLEIQDQVSSKWAFKEKNR